ncbi:hypothetical protein EX30DRAFT_398767 [Ascodesmis nigricans]|uniref:Uncharacterized protein n=1 Tax=Ascodesmis nigricans TaxID=341454 RepID=A0A4S2MJF6_9PEZI|nr:hypothetical protein EX30DRAFT_398767 [Ascodesmis nigricans]
MPMHRLSKSSLHRLTSNPEGPATTDSHTTAHPTNLELQQLPPPYHPHDLIDRSEYDDDNEVIKTPVTANSLVSEEPEMLLQKTVVAEVLAGLQGLLKRSKVALWVVLGVLAVVGVALAVLITVFFLRKEKAGLLIKMDRVLILTLHWGILAAIGIPLATLVTLLFARRELKMVPGRGKCLTRYRNCTLLAGHMFARLDGVEMRFRRWKITAVWWMVVALVAYFLVLVAVVVGIRYEWKPVMMRLRGWVELGILCGLMVSCAIGMWVTMIVMARKVGVLRRMCGKALDIRNAV